MKTLVSHSLEETSQIASDWLKSLEAKYLQPTEAVAVGLSGHLGAGKTAFVKQLSKKLGVNEEVTSPTFVIMKIYETKHPIWPRMVHIDAYRLERREELEAIDFESVIADPKNLVLIEWPENAQLKRDDLHERIEFVIKDDERHISIQ